MAYPVYMSRKYTYKGTTRRIVDWAWWLGIRPSELLKKLCTGTPPDEIFKSLGRQEGVGLKNSTAAPP